MPVTRTRYQALLIAFILPLISFLPGCASVIHGTTQAVQIQSVPSGAEIHINGAYRGTTPKLVELPRGASYQLLLEHTGYQPWDLDLERRFSAWALGNVVTGILPGAALDAIDGAAFRVYPPGVTATLIPVRQPPPRNWAEQRLTPTESTSAPAEHREQQ